MYTDLIFKVAIVGMYVWATVLASRMLLNL
jgi:hypothetical protein